MTDPHSMRASKPMLVRSCVLPPVVVNLKKTPVERAQDSPGEEKDDDAED